MAEKWVTTSCDRCYVGCGVRAHVVDGVVVGLEGDPKNPLNRGKMCAKGKAGLMAHYNPNRVLTPLKRTNPEKGIGTDPKWQEISYEEALDTIAEKMRQIQDDPQKFYVYCWGYDCDLKTIASGFGSPHVHTAGAHECGKSIHVIEHMFSGFHQAIDLHYCNYALYVGTQASTATRTAYTHTVRDLAEARARGMKLVVVDPLGGYAAAKADEWIPIRPGTDAAFGLAMINILINELGIYDAEFLKKGTNSAYLVGADGRYIREEATGKPMIFDPVDGAAKTFDDPSIKDYALLGQCEVNGKSGTAAFDLFKKHVARYTPEYAAKITTIPAATIARIAREFGEASRIGSTIVLEGKQLPFRPAALDWARGPQGHKHGFQHCWALKLVNVLMGNVNMPGGILSTGARGENPYHWGPESVKDGMLSHSILGGYALTPMPSSFPGRKPGRPQRMDLVELFPLAPHGTVLYPLAGAEPEKFGLDYRIEVGWHNPSNVILTCFADLKVAEKFYKNIGFVIGYAYELNETTEAFDDIVLPMPSYLERQDIGGRAFSGVFDVLTTVGQDDWYFQMTQKVVDSEKPILHPTEVAFEIADRLGLIKEFNTVKNRSLRFKEPFFLEPERKYSLDELHDRVLQSMFGPGHGLEWSKENCPIRYHRGVDEAYQGKWMMDSGIRVPIYLEHYLDRGDELKKVIAELGMEWDFSDFQPFPDWLPCDAYEGRGKNDFDFVTVHYKLPFTYGHYANENPWINEICERTPYSYTMLINEDAARSKGIREGDEIWIESSVRKAKGTAKLTQCIHPEVVAIAGHFGHWAKGMPVSRGKGVAYNALLPHDLDHIDKISGALDNCALVKITKVEKSR